jgi:translation initiation factor IF-1
VTSHFASKYERERPWNLFLYGRALDSELSIWPMAKDDLAQLEGKIVDAGAGGLYKVMLDNQVQIVARLCGKMRRFNIRVVVGDKVTVGVSPYDPTNGLILYRHK